MEFIKLTEEELNQIDNIKDEKLSRRIEREMEHINRHYRRLSSYLAKEKRNGKYRHNII